MNIWPNVVESLEARFWEREFVNDYEMMILEAEIGWEVEPGSHEDSIVISAISEMGIVELEVQTTAWETLCDGLVAHQEDPDPRMFFTFLHKQFPGQVYNLKTIEDERLRFAFHPDTVFKPRMVPHEGDLPSFGLAYLVDSALLLPVNQHDRALDRLSEMHDEEALDYADLEDFFEKRLGIPAVFNAAGDLIDLEQGGDLWALEEIKALADLMSNDSFVWMQDEGHLFWRIEFEDGAVQVLREVPEK